MCIAAFAFGAAAEAQGYRLVLAANRDEALLRPALPLRWWEGPCDLVTMVVVVVVVVLVGMIPTRGGSSRRESGWALASPGCDAFAVRLQGPWRMS